MPSRIKTFARRTTRGLARAAADSRAVTAVEFAFVAPIILALMLGTIQVAVIYLAQAELETATEAAERLVLTNQAQAMTASTFKTALCGNLPALFTCANVMVDLTAMAGSSTSCSAIAMAPPTLTYDGSGNVNNTWNFQPGTYGQVERLRVMYQWPVIAGPLGLVFSDLANGSLFMQATAVFQNESQ